MKQEKYKLFKEAISTAGAKDPVWWAGYLWIDLTEKQGREVFKILGNRRDNVCKTIISLRNSRIEIEIPSGIRLFIEK